MMHAAVLTDHTNKNIYRFFFIKLKFYPGKDITVRRRGFQRDGLHRM